MPPAAPLPDPDDFFADTRMSFGDHIEELRAHLLRAIYGFVIALVFSFFIGRPVLKFITAPVEDKLHEYYDRRVQQTMAELASNPELLRENQPTPFAQLTFRRDQFLAAVQGEPAEVVNAFPKPFAARSPRANGASSWVRWLTGVGAEPEKPAQGEEEISSDNVVKLWVRHEQPLEETALMMAAIRRVGEFGSLTTLSATEAFMVYFKVCLLCGAVIGSPWIFYQIWAFIAAGLYPHEKRLVHVYLPFSLGLFLGGVFLCEFLVIPRALDALLWFNEWLDLKPDLRLNEWLGFALLLPLVFGLSFQTPMIMMFLVRVGIMDVESFRGKRRLAWFVMAVIAAVVTPTPDAITMILLWVPMSLLFELGIYLVARLAPPELDSDLEPEELVGA
jgi:sec-independent protein translocase protein TatC